MSRRDAIEPVPPETFDGMTREQVKERRTALRTRYGEIERERLTVGSSARRRLYRQCVPLVAELRGIGLWLKAHPAPPVIAGADVATWEAAARANGGAV